MGHNKCLAYNSNVKTGCALIRNPAFFIGLICVNQIEEIEQFTAMSLLICHDKFGLNANVLKTCCASIIEMNVEEL